MKKSKNKKLEIKNLAIFGGQKSIIFKQPHWKWPPQSSGKNKAINNYYKNEKNPLHLLNYENHQLLYYY